MPYVKQEEYDRIINQAVEETTELKLEIYSLRGELKAQEILIDKLLNKLVVAGMVARKP